MLLKTIFIKKKQKKKNKQLKTKTKTKTKKKKSFKIFNSPQLNANKSLSEKLINKEGVIGVYFI